MDVKSGNNALAAQVRRRADQKLEQECEQLAAEIAVKDERVEALMHKLNGSME